MHPEQYGYELSIIIPTLDEEACIDALLRNLACQQGADLEVLVCDGGSKDATVDRALAAAAGLPFPLRVISGTRGRGRQMNAGARVARGEYLLFLHADSLFPDGNALNSALSALRRITAENGDHPAAGRFRLRFLRAEATSSFFYYYAECKARLDRTGSTHGDQGLMLDRALFKKAGPFDESCTVLEDTLLAERVRRIGKWHLFEPEILTSSRRYETEGRLRRQFLNAVIMALNAVGRDEIISELPEIYSAQQLAGRLRLLPFLKRISERLDGLRWRERVSFWQGIGGYLAGNAWQPAFALDVSKSYRQGLPPGTGGVFWLGLADRLSAVILDNPPVRVPAAFLAWLLFRCCVLLSGGGRTAAAE